MDQHDPGASGDYRTSHEAGHPARAGARLYETPYSRLMEAMREDEFLQVLNLTPLFVTVLGPRRQRLYINDVGLDCLGTSTERWRETLPSAELHPEDVDPVQDYWNGAIATGLPFECEFRSRRSDGSYRWLLGRLSKVADAKGDVRRWYLACTDIEERKREEERKRREKAAAAVEIGLEKMRLDRVLTYICENFRDEIPLQRLADIAGYSLFHFARKFTLTVGVSPQRYIARMRLENAMRELADGKLPLAEIAFNAGFSSQASFARAFHRNVGTTPKRYRQYGFRP